MRQIKVRRSLWLGVLVGLMLAADAGADDGADLDSLAWLSGCWVGEQGGVVTEECWSVPRGGLMLGWNRSGGDGTRVGFEFLRIQDAGQGLAYLASPGGRPPTPFPVASIEERQVIFENAEHDFPQRIRYRLDVNGMLHVRIEGQAQGKSQSIEWLWQRSSLP